MPDPDASGGERLNRFLARCGVASRRACDGLIAAGRVRVNGDMVNTLGTRIDPESDQVEVDGTVVRPPTAYRYYLLYKPVGYVTTAADPHAERIAQSLVPPSPRLFSVGRLDADSEGLLLYTNDGQIAQRLTHPRYEHPKEYLVLARGAAPEDLRERFAEGVLLPGEEWVARSSLTTLPTGYRFRAQAAPRGSVWFRLVVREGRKRLVRRMFEAAGLQVERLVRVRMGPLRLGDLQPGAGRWLEAEEVRALVRYGRERER
ncbi:MAG: pseudouridine synthase [Anaerolineae bacterium]|jgi:23S rRNA pseudouridine2605 synthase